MQPVNQVCQGDTVEIAINLFNMQGMIDTQTLMMAIGSMWNYCHVIEVCFKHKPF